MNGRVTADDLDAVGDENATILALGGPGGYTGVPRAISALRTHTAHAR